MILDVIRVLPKQTVLYNGLSSMEGIEEEKKSRKWTKIPRESRQDETFPNPFFRDRDETKTFQNPIFRDRDEKFCPRNTRNRDRDGSLV